MCSSQIDGDHVTITGPDHGHLCRVLRTKVGDSVEILDNSGSAFCAVVCALEKEAAHLRIEGTIPPASEPRTRIAVAQSLCKPGKFEMVLQHGTELGAAQFVPVLSDRSIIDRGKGPGAEKAKRWAAIAKGAAEQCGRCRLPEIAATCSSRQLFNPAVSGQSRELMPTQLRLILEPGDSSEPLDSCILALQEMPPAILIAIGPEGGWSSSEIERACEAGWSAVRVESYILRTETAALAAISQLTICLRILAQRLESRG